MEIDLENVFRDTLGEGLLLCDNVRVVDFEIEGVFLLSVKDIDTLKLIDGLTVTLALQVVEVECDRLGAGDAVTVVETVFVADLVDELVKDREMLRECDADGVGKDRVNDVVTLPLGAGVIVDDVDTVVVNDGESETEEEAVWE